MKGCLTLLVLLFAAPAVRAGSSVVIVAAPTPASQSAAAASRVEALLRAQLRASRLEQVELEERLGVPVTEAHQAIAQAAADLQRARALFTELDIPRATPLLLGVVSTYEKHVAVWRDARPLIDALTLLAACAFVQRSGQEGQWFSALFALRPDAEPDADILNPPMQRAFAKAKESVGKRTARVEVQADAGASVFVDGLFRGIAPLEVEQLEEGRHFVRVALLGRQSAGRLIELVAGTQTSVRVSLPPTPLHKEWSEALAGALDPGGDRSVALRTMSAVLGTDMLLLAQVAAGPRGPVQVVLSLEGLERGATLAHTSLSLDRAASDAEWARELEGALKTFAPPPIAVGLSLTADRKVRKAPLTVVTRTFAEALGKQGSVVTVLAEPIAERCYAQPGCVGSAVQGTNVDAVARVHLSQQSKEKEIALSLQVYDPAAGDLLASARMVIPEGSFASALTVPMELWRALDRVWERRAPLNPTLPLLMSAPQLASIDPEPAPRDGLTATAGAQPEATSWRRIGGYTAAGGSVLFALGYGFAALEAKTLRDASSTGDEKKGALGLGRVGLGVAGAGLAAVITGLVMVLSNPEPAAAP